LEVHLVPANREHANTVLRYYETMVDGDGRFKMSHIAPGRYFSITRIRPAGEIKEQQTPAAWSTTVRSKLRRDAELSKTIVELKSCQQVSDFELNVAP
jgi:hypothetical protein